MGQGAQTCSQFKQTHIMGSPLSCLFEGQDCFMDSCNQIIGECKNNEQCASALNLYIYQETNDYTLCGNSEECIQTFGQIMDCLNQNCIIPITQNDADKQGDNDQDKDENHDTLNSTQEPIIIIASTEEKEHHENDDKNTEIPPMKEQKIMMEQAATN